MRWAVLLLGLVACGGRIESEPEARPVDAGVDAPSREDAAPSHDDAAPSVPTCPDVLPAATTCCEPGPGADVCGCGDAGNCDDAPMLCRCAVGSCANGPGGFGAHCGCVPTPKATACSSAQCGSAPDGCGGLYSCGTCPTCAIVPVETCDPTPPAGCQVMLVQGIPGCCCVADGG